MRGLSEKACEENGNVPPNGINGRNGYHKEAGSRFGGLEPSKGPALHQRVLKVSEFFGQFLFDCNFAKLSANDQSSIAHQNCINTLFGPTSKQKPKTKVFWMGNFGLSKRSKAFKQKQNIYIKVQKKR